VGDSVASRKSYHGDVVIGQIMQTSPAFRSLEVRFLPRCHDPFPMKENSCLYCWVFVGPRVLLRFSLEVWVSVGREAVFEPRLCCVVSGVKGGSSIVSKQFCSGNGAEITKIPGRTKRNSKFGLVFVDCEMFLRTQGEELSAIDNQT